MRAVVLVTALVLFTDATSPFPRPTARESADDRTAEVWRAILAIEDARTLTALELKTLSDLIRSRADGLEAAALAVRALGRIERPDAVPVLLEVLHVEGLRDEAATALMLILRASAAQAQASADMSAIIDQVIPVAAAPVLARLPYTRPDQVVRVEKQLLSLIDARLSYRPLGTVSRAFETLTRLNRKLWQPSGETLEAIRRIARAGMPGMTRADWMPRMNAVAALIAAGAVTREVIADTINDAEPQVRRLAVFALSVGISKIDEGPRREIILKALADPSPLVRYEGVRAWARHEAATHGCAPLIDGRSDPDLHVGLAAIDALGDQCRGDGTIDRWLAGDLKTVVTAREWHRPVHALVALAKRAPERAAQHLQPFVRHRTWQVRMYAARAAGHMRDLRSLERLANDEDDNVRDAALPHLHGIKTDPNHTALLGALGRTDYQLLLTAVNLLKGSAPGSRAVGPMLGALERVTAERKDTSRDLRLALIERIRELATVEEAHMLAPYARDFDPRVAEAAASVYHARTGRTTNPAPKPLPRPPMPTREELEERVAARFDLEIGGRFDVVLAKEHAPLACTRFARLVRQRYYDGLSFHRVVPNFVIQGGSPGANEYAGDGPFMRDELSPAWHARGTVGISTRGRDTGDAQIFINLVDNPRLDFDYTVFARVKEGDMRVVDRIQEGARIVRVRLIPDRPP